MYCLTDLHTGFFNKASGGAENVPDEKKLF
jgi:hypothetical protein